MKNIFIEGLQGTGKSALMQKLSECLPTYHVYREGDLSPADLAWCAYVSESQFKSLLEKYPQFEREIMAYTAFEGNMRIIAYTRILTDMPEFYTHMESHEIYNGRVPFDRFKTVILNRYKALKTSGHIFECAFFQNAIEAMMLFYQMSDEAIFQFYKSAYAVLKEKDFVMLYLDSEDVRADIAQIKAERVDVNGKEMWFPLMMAYLKTSPYGTAHHLETFDDLVCHLKRRQNLEKQIIRDVLGAQAIILKAKDYDIQSVMNAL